MASTSNNGFIPMQRPASQVELFAPKYYRLKHALREAIAQMQADESIPSETVLCQTHHVSRTTVRKAINDLAQEGLVYTVQGKGTFVAPKKLVSGWVQQTGGLFADMTERGFKVTMKVLSVGVILADDGIQKELQIGEEEVVRIIRLRYVDDRPFDVVTNYLPARMFPGLEKEDFEGSSLYSILKSKYHVKFERGVRLVEAGVCTAEEARLLRMKPNSPVLIMRSTMFDENGNPFEHGIGHQRSDVAQIVINVIPH